MLQNERVSCWFPIGSVREIKKELEKKDALVGRNDTFAGRTSLFIGLVEKRIGGDMCEMEVITRREMVKDGAKSETLVSDVM